MSASHILRFHVRYVAGCLLRHGGLGDAFIPGTSSRTAQMRRYLSSFTKSAYDGNLLLATGNCALTRAREFCSETDPAEPVVRTKRGRKPTVPNVATKQYLTSLGVNSDLIQEHTPTVLLEDVAQIKRHQALLQSLNFTDREIVDILTKTPQLLKVDTSSVQEHIQFLQDLEIDNHLILNIFQRVPKFFATPLSRIQANVEYMQSLNLTNKNIRIVLKYTPSLVFRKKDGIRQAGDCLRRVLLEHEPTCNLDTSLSYMLRTDPLLFGRAIYEIEHRVDHLISLGFSGVALGKIMRFCPSVLRIGTEFITERMKLVQARLSLSDEETRDMVQRLPKILHASNETINTKIDFLLKKGFKPSDIYQAPRVLNASLQRMESRLEKLSELNYRPKTLSIMQKSEEWFQDLLEELRQQKSDENEEKESPEE